MVSELLIGGAAARIMGAEWAELTAEEREQAVSAAGQEGWREARRQFSAPGSRGGIRALRCSPWVRAQGGLKRLDDRTLYMYAAGWSRAREEEYVERVIEARCPEQAAWWWGAEPEERQRDLRVCAFCDGYERERRRILGLAAPPAGIAELQLYLWAAKEREREAGRGWLKSTQTSYSTEEYGEQQQCAAKLEYQRCELCTDLAEMLLTTASGFSPGRDEGIHE